MAPKTKGQWLYAVKKGQEPGIYPSWEACESQTKGFPGAKYKKFATQAEAEAYMSGAPSSSDSNSLSKDATSLTSTEASSSKGATSKKRDFGPEVEDVTGWDVVYSDGACKGNGKAGSYAGVGVWWGHNDPRNIAERCPGDQTNNRAELIAILRVLESTSPKSKKPLLIRTDSQYSIQCFKTWIHNWIKRGWRNATGGLVKNAGIIRCISAHLDIRGKMGQKVILEYVKGHSGDTGNDGADLMANQGAMQPQTAERPWDQIEVQLRRRMLEIGIAPDTPAAQLTVLAPENLAEAEAEVIDAPAKMRKLAAPEIIPSSKSKPLSQTKVASVESPLKARSQSTLAATQASTSSSTLHEPPPPPLPKPKQVHPSASSTAATKGRHKTPSPQKPNTTTSGQTNASSSVTTNAIVSYPHLSGEKSPMKVLCARPPLVPVKVGEVNLDDYADCLLEDPSNDLSD